MRIMLRDLSPATVYNLQVRTTSTEASSPWSRKFVLETPVDAMPPASPAGLVITMAGGGALLSWDAVTYNEDGSQLTDLSTYRVTVKSPDGAGSYVKDVGISTNMEFTFDMNRKTFGVPKGRLFFDIVAIDTVGNLSDVSTSDIATITPLPNVTGLTATPASGAIALKWDTVTHPALAGFKVYSGTTADFPLTTPVAETGSNAYLHSTSAFGTDLWFKVVAFDVFGNLSPIPAVAGPVRPTSPYSVDTEGPSTPGGLTAVISNNTMNVSWNEVVISDLRYYIVSYRPVGSTVWSTTNVPYDQTSTAIQVIPGVNYQVRVLASDQMSNMSSYSPIVTTTTATINTAPSVPTGLNIDPGRDSVQISWNENTELDMKNNVGTYDVTVATNSAFTTGVLQYRTGATSLSINGLSTDTQYWARIRATDAGDLSSAYSSSVSATTGSFPETSLSDGDAPSTSPKPVVSPGISYLHVSWTPVANNDIVTYEVHIGTTTGFSPSASTKVAEITGSSVIANVENAAGAALVKGKNYFVKTIAKDVDGAAPASASTGPVALVITVQDVEDNDSALENINDTVIPSLETKVNAAVKNYVNEYSVGSSETVAPTGGWSTSTPTRTPGTFIWFRTVITYTDDTTQTTNPALLTGNTGETGPQGPQGIEGSAGSDGADGQSLYTWIKYADTPTSGMSDSPTGKEYIGIAYNQTSSTESSSYGVYEWTLVKGETGDQGVQGPPGADGQPTYTWIKYAPNGNPTNAQISDDPAGMTHIGLAYNKTTQTESASASAYKWALIQGPKGDTGNTGPKGDAGNTGPKGDTGNTGVGVTSITPYYRQTADTASAPAKPTTATPSGWSATEPAYAANTSLWRTDKVLYTNSTFAYTAVTKVSSYAAAAVAQATADGKNTVIYSTSAATGTNFKENDLWFQRNASYRIIGQWVFESGAWKPVEIDGQVIANLDAGVITSGYIDADRIKANSLTIGMVSSLQDTIDAAVDTAADDATEKADAAKAASLPRVSVGASSKTFRNPLTVSTVNTTTQILIRTPLTAPSSVSQFKYVLSGTSTYANSAEIGFEVSHSALGNTLPFFTPSMTNVGTFPVKVTMARETATGRLCMILSSTVSFAASVISVDAVTVSNHPAALDSWIDGWSSTETFNMADFENVTEITDVRDFDRDSAARAAAAKEAAIQQAASDASLEYSRAKELTTEWGYPTGTEINGAFLRTGTVAANRIVVGGGTLDTEWDTKATNTYVDTAKSQAISTAAGDATTKANAAKQAALDELATAETALQQAIANGDQDAIDAAQTKADAARDAAIAESVLVENRALSRGTDLITNGTGYLGNNYNFSSFSFDPSDSPVGANGSFVYESNNYAGVIRLDEFVPVDPSKSYRMSLKAREQNFATAGETRIYAGIAPYDAFGNAISVPNYYYKASTETTLAAPLNPGDTTVTIVGSTDGWNVSPARYLGVWDYEDEAGKVWPFGTYTRDAQLIASVSGSTITLSSPFSGAARPAGTKVSNNSSGGSYMYIGASNARLDDTWQEFRGREVGGIHDGSIGSATVSFPPGTATVLPMFLINYQPGKTGSSQAIAAVSFSDVVAANEKAGAAQQTADAVTDLTDSWKFTGKTTIDGGRIETDSVSAAVIKAGSTFTQNLGVSGTFTLGNGGIIKTATGGVQLTDSGIIIPSGHLDANVLKGNTAFVNVLNVGAGGAIQSTGYTSGGSTGFQLSNTGLTIKGAGNIIDASVIKGGTITGTTVNIGAGGTLNIDSTAQVKSNNYASGSTGYRLSNSGLEINDGTINAKTLKADSSIINDLIIGETAAGSGGIKSFDYVANSKGFRLSTAGLEINKGSIAAEALKLQIGRNLLHPAFADFEFENLYYASLPNYFAGYSIESSDFKFNSKSMKITWSGGVSASVTLAPTTTSYNANFDSSRKIIISAWVKAPTALSIALTPVFETTGAPVTTESAAKPVTSGWTRIYHVFTPPADSTGKLLIKIVSKTSSSGNSLFIDGIQVEEVLTALEEPSTWMPTSTTSIDGGMFTTGVIRSSALNSRGAPLWSINTQGNAIFNKALVHEEMIVGNPDWAPNLAVIKSVSYQRNASGWAIDSDGRAEFNDGTFRGRLGFGIVSTNLVADGSFEEGGDGWLDWSDTPNPDRWGWVAAGGHFNVPVKTREAARTGGQSLKIPISSNTTHVNGVASPVFSVVAGESYKVSVHYKGEHVDATGLNLRLKMSATTTEVADVTSASDITSDDGSASLHDASGSEDVLDLTSNVVEASSSSIVSSTSEGFYGVAAVFTVPPTKTFATVKVEVSRSTTTGGGSSVYIDDVTVTRVGRSAADVSSAGIRLFDETGSEAAAFVHNRPNYLSIIEDGTNLATISESGDATFSTMAINESEVYIGGSPLLGRFKDYEPAGAFDPIDENDERGLLEKFPKGAIARGLQKPSPKGQTQGLYQLSFWAEKGRMYKITFVGARIKNNLGGVYFGPTVYMESPSTPGGTASDTSLSSRFIMDMRQVSESGSGINLFPEVSTIVHVGYDGNSGRYAAKEGLNKLLLGIAVGSSSSVVTFEDAVEVIVEDIGLRMSNSFEVNETTGSTPGVGDRAGKIKRRKTYEAYTSRAWDSSNNVLRGSDVVQGYAPSGGGGLHKGAWYFPSSLTTDLSPAEVSVEKIEVYLYPRQWKHSYGGTALIRIHHQSGPTTWPPQTWVDVGGMQMKAAQGKWFTIPSRYYSGFKNGTYKGFGVGSGTSRNYRYYGRFEGRANPPNDYTVAKIRVTTTV